MDDRDVIYKQLELIVREQQALARSIAGYHKDVTNALKETSLFQQPAPDTTRSFSKGSASVSSASVPPSSVNDQCHQCHSAADGAEPMVSEYIAPGPRFSVVSKRPTEETATNRRTKRLKTVFERFEEKEEWSQHVKKESIRSRLKVINSDRNRFETTLDSVMGVIIWVNSLYLGFECDLNKTEFDNMSGWTAVSIFFSCVFWVELCFKMRLHGFSGQFCGAGRVANIFDAALVVVDTAQIAIEIFGAQLTAIPSASLFRLFRLVRLVRLIRLLRAPIFKDLLTMVYGMLGGMTTLGWSLVLVFLVIYSIGVVCRELLGYRMIHGVREYFDSVPRSLMTIFRCSFGDCVAISGEPIIEIVSRVYGGGWAIGYALFIFFVTIGFFNVITAIFLESTMASASDLAMKNQRDRLEDKIRWSTCISILVRKILARTGFNVPAGSKLSEQMDMVMGLQVKRSELNELIKEDGEVRELLHALDIDPEDHKSLGDICDADHSGSVEILELVNGLQRLRGSKLRRSDIVSLDLMIRDLQDRVSEISQDMKITLGHNLVLVTDPGQSPDPAFQI